MLGCGIPPTRPSSTSTPPTTTTPVTNPSSTTTVGTLTTVATTEGESFGGKQAIVGAHIYLFAANTSGWGQASTSLLNPTKPGVSHDKDGAYVTSSSTGNFSFTGLYTCTPGQQVYVYASNGNPGFSGVVINPVIGMLATFGTCPASGNFAGQISSFVINEVSTVATAYSLAGFMTDPTHVSSSNSANALNGLANAFNNYNNLVDLETGTAKANNDAGNGFIPQAKINSLANLLVPCINSTGSGTACNTLFAATRPSANDPLPANTAAAVLNMAHNPGLNVATLFKIAAANSPYLPTLTSAPNDWTLSITFFSDDMPGPYYPAIDSQGNLWVPGYASNNLTEFAPMGYVLLATRAAGINQPFAVAIDAQDSPWVVNFTPGATTISQLLNNGNPITTTPYACGTSCFFPAFDPSGNLWVSGTDHTTVISSSGSKVSSFLTDAYASGIAIASNGSGWTLGHKSAFYHLTLPSSSTRLTQPLTATTGNDVTPVAIDSTDNVWFASSRNNTLGKADPNGAMVSAAGGYTGGGLSGPAGIAIDGSNRVWVANRDASSISEFSNSGTALSPTTGFGTDSYVSDGVNIGLSGPRGIAIDPSGNVWVANFTYNSVTEFVGIATPVATPISATSHGKLP
jgi:streptogramin lyase